MIWGVSFQGTVEATYWCKALLDRFPVLRISVQLALLHFIK